MSAASESVRDDRTSLDSTLVDEYAEFLTQVRLFAGLDRLARARLAGYLESRWVADGTLVFQQGDAPDGLYLVRRGRFSVLRSTPDEACEVWLSSCTQGDSFGEIGLITGEARTASVRAASDGEVLRLEQARFREFVTGNPSVALAVAAQLIRELQVADIARSEAHGSGITAAVDSVPVVHVAVSPSVPTRTMRSRHWTTTGLQRAHVGMVVALCTLAASWLVAPPAGLDLAGWRAILGLVATVPLFATAALPDGIVALFLVGVWALGGSVDLSTALSGFTSSAWLLTLSVLAIASGVAATGLIFRLALWAATRTRGGFAGQAASLVVSGLCISAAFPETTGRTALMAIATGDLAEALGYLPGSRASVGVAMSVFAGYGLTTAPFLTSSSTALLTYTLLPQAARDNLDWTTWAVRAAPFFVVLLVGLTASVVWLYRPERSDSANSGQQQRRRVIVALQRALLGHPGSKEWAAALIVIFLIGGFLTGSIHHIAPVSIALVALVLLSVVGVVTADSIRSINWNLLVLFGVVASTQQVFESTGVNAWLAEVLEGPLRPLATRPVLFLTVLTLLCVAVSFLLRMPTAAPIMTVAFGPVAMAAGIDPWVVALLALVACSNFIFAYQSNPYQALQHGICGHFFTDAQTRPLAIVYVILTCVALWASVPLWHMMGLL
jgi:CRP-like cAMP-binding protein/di/tricarboxylate transporter